MGHAMDNTEVVKKFLTAQYAGKIDEAFDMYAHDQFTWVVGSKDNGDLKSQIPWAGYKHKGKDGYKTLTGMLYGEYDSQKFETHHFSEAAGKVFVEGNFVFKHRVTGKIVDSDFVAVFKMRDGKISGGQFFENTAGVAAARIKS